jgi:hypothetical protein
LWMFWSIPDLKFAKKTFFRSPQTCWVVFVAFLDICCRKKVFFKQSNSHYLTMGFQINVPRLAGGCSFWQKSYTFFFPFSPFRIQTKQ